MRLAGGGEVPQRRAVLYLSERSGWLLGNKQQMSSAVTLYNFKNTFMDTVSFDFITVLWEYVCQLLLFPFSDENTGAQITWLAQIHIVGERDYINFSRLAM